MRRAADSPVTHIRPYHPADRAGILACIVELQEFERGLEPRRMPGKAMAAPYFRGLMAQCRREKGRVLVAKLARRIVGFICVLAGTTDSPELNADARTAWITDMIVLPHARGRGIGQKLLRAAEDYARKRGAPRIYIQVLKANRGAHNLYMKAGFVEYAVDLIKELPGRASGKTK